MTEKSKYLSTRAGKAIKPSVQSEALHSNGSLFTPDFCYTPAVSENCRCVAFCLQLHVFFALSQGSQAQVARLTPLTCSGEQPQQRF